MLTQQIVFFKYRPEERHLKFRLEETFFGT